MRVDSVPGWIVVSALLLAGCAGTKNAVETGKNAEAPAAVASKPAESFPTALEPAARVLAEKLAVGLEQSLKTGDFEPFRATLPKGGREITPEMFAQMRMSLERRYGKLIRTDYFGSLNQGKVVDFLWKFTFEQKEASGRISPREVVYLVRTGAVNDQPVIAGFGFNFF